MRCTFANAQQFADERQFLLWNLERLRKPRAQPDVFAGNLAFALLQRGQFLRESAKCCCEQRFLPFLFVALPGERGAPSRGLRQQHGCLPRVRQERCFIVTLRQVDRSCERIILLRLFLLCCLLLDQRPDILLNPVYALADLVVLNGNAQVNLLLHQPIETLVERIALPLCGGALLTSIIDGRLKQRFLTASDVHGNDLDAPLHLGDARLQLLIFPYLVHERLKHGKLPLRKLSQSFLATVQRVPGRRSFPAYVRARRHSIRRCL